MTVETDRQSEMPKSSPGADLRRVREQAGISLQQIADRTLISLARLEALEQDDFDRVGGPAYVTGYTRAYARVIGVSPDTYVKAFEQALEAEKPSEPQPTQVSDTGVMPTSRHGTYVVWGAAVFFSIMAILVVVFVSAALNESDPDPDPAPQLSSPAQTSPAASEQAQASVTASVRAEGQASIEPDPALAEPTAEPGGTGSPPVIEQSAAEPSAPEVAVEPESGDALTASAMANTASDAAGNTATPEVTPSQPRIIGSQEPAVTPPAEEDLLVLGFAGECWVEVYDANGERVVARLAQSGDNLRLFGQAPFEVLLGNAWVVDMALNGESVSVRPRPGRNTLRLTVGT